MDQIDRAESLKSVQLINRKGDEQRLFTEPRKMTADIERFLHIFFNESLLHAWFAVPVMIIS